MTAVLLGNLDSDVSSKDLALAISQSRPLGQAMCDGFRLVIITGNRDDSELIDGIQSLARGLVMSCKPAKSSVAELLALYRQHAPLIDLLGAPISSPAKTYTSCLKPRPRLQKHAFRRDRRPPRRY